MPVFTAGAAAIATAIGFTAGTTGFLIAQSLIAAGLAAGTGHLLGVFDDDSGLPAVEDPGVEQRLGANTQNRVPMLYGQFMQRGSLTYFEISEDRKTLYSIITIGEGPVTSIDQIWWDDIRVTLGAGGEVVSAVDVEGNDVTRLNGNLNINVYRGLASNNSTYLEDLVDDWTPNHKMTGLVYAVVTVRYNRDADITGLNDLRFIGTAPINDPADAVMDQLTNERYGLGLPATSIDTASFTAAKTYYSEMLPYEDAAGVTQMAPRFEVNGSINSADPVFERIEAILLGSNSSLRWQNGKYSIFVNKADTVEAFDMDESKVVGDISVSEVGLNSVVNSVEVQYGRDAANNYQRNTLTVNLPTANRYPNEQDRVRSLDLPLVRTFVEAERIAFILLNQSREQLSIKHMSTVAAMPLEAGDVITYTLPNYGWDEKQFRVTRVSEMEVEDGLQYQIEAVEYAASVYTDRTHIEPGASPNTNIPALDQLTAVTDLAIANRNDAAAQPNFELTWTSPQSSLVERFDVYVNNLLAPFDSDSTQFLHSVFPPGMRSSFNPAEPVSNVVYGLPAGSYNIWVVARNSLAASAESNTVELTTWTPRINNDGISAEIGDISIRLHENLATNDPGAPTGEEGIGGDWYDPSGQFGTIPDDPDPHWEARGVGAVTTAGLPRVADFALSGQGGLIQVNSTSQSYRFDVTGTPGARVQTGSAQQEITNFNITGTTSGGPTGGSQASWNLDFAGSSDTTVPSINEEFYIYLDGDSGPVDSPASLYIRPTGETVESTGSGVFNLGNLSGTESSAPPSGTFSTHNLGRFIYNSNNLTQVREILQFLSSNVPNDYNPPVGNVFEADTFVSTNAATLTVSNSSTASLPDGDYVSTVGSNIDVYETETFSSGTGVYQIIIHGFSSITSAVGSGQSANFVISGGTLPTELNVAIPQGNIDGTFIFMNASTNDIAIRNELVTLMNANTDFTSAFTITADTSSGISGLPDGTPIVKLVATSISTVYSAPTLEFHGDGDLTGSTAGVLEQRVVALPPQVQISIPTENINRTLTLEPGNTGATQLRNSLLTRIQADAVISGEFTATAITSSGISGLANGLPIVKLTANDLLDHSISVTFTNRDGDLTGSQFGTIVDGQEEGISTEIRITYDDVLAPNMQDIVIGSAANGDAIASIVATAIDGHSELTAAVETSTDTLPVQTVTTFNIANRTESTSVGFTVDPSTSANVINSNYWAMESNLDSSSSFINPTSWSDTHYFLVNTNAVSGFPSGAYITIRNNDSSVYFTGRVTGTNNIAGNSNLIIELSVATTGEGIELLGSAGDPSDLDGIFIDVYRSDPQPAGRVVVETVNQGEFSAPVVSLIERGTSVGFASDVTVVSPGGAPVGDSSSYRIRRGSSTLLTRDFTNNIDAEAAAMELQAAIDGLTQYTATVVGSVVTATSTENSNVNITVTINDGTGGNLNVSRTVTQEGSATDTFTGSDATASVRIGGSQIGSLITATGETNTDIAIAIAAAFNTDARFTATVSTNTVTIEATFTGGTPDATIVVVPGTDPDGDTSDFAISRAVISDGLGDGTTSGTAASYAISVGGTNVANGNFLNGTSSAQAAITLSSALGSIDTYDGQSLAGSILRATSTFEGTSPDIVITIAAGTDADGSAGTLSVTKTVTQEGQFPGMDFTNTVWTYYVINQEVRVDDDTIDMMDNNTLQIRRGIIEDTQAWDDVSGNTDPNGVTSSSNEVAYLTESFSSSSRNTTAIVQLNMLGTATIFEKATDPVSMGFVLQQSTDAGVTWTNAISTFTFGVTTTDASLVYRTAAPISASNTLTLTPSQTYWFRMLRVFVEDGSVIAPPAAGNYGNFLVNMLVLEELTA